MPMLLLHSSLDGSLACSTFQRSWTMMPWIWVFKYVFETNFSALRCIYPVVELLGHLVILFLIVLMKCHADFHSSYTILHSSHSVRGSNNSTSLPACLSSLSDFWGCRHMDVRWCLIEILTYISPVISHIKHLFRSLLTICVSSWRKSLFKYFAHFWFGLFVFLLLSWEVLCLFWIFSPCQIDHLQIWAPMLHGLCFYSVEVVFRGRKGFNIHEFWCVYSVFYCPCLECHIHEIIAKSYCETFCPMFSSKCFSSYIWVLIHWELSFISGVRSESKFRFCMKISTFSGTTGWKDCLFPVEQPWPPYFWALYSVPMLYVSVFMPLQCCFDTAGLPQVLHQ